MNTVGAVLLFGGSLCVYAVLSHTTIQLWVNLTDKEIKSQFDLAFIKMLIISAQQLISFVNAAVGAGLVASAIFQARVKPRLDDNKLGIAKRKK